MGMSARSGAPPRWFMRSAHMDPVEAVQLHRDLGSKRSLAIHWGTFHLTDEARDEPGAQLAAARTADGLDPTDLQAPPTRRKRHRLASATAPLGPSGDSRRWNHYPFGGFPTRSCVMSHITFAVP